MSAAPKSPRRRAREFALQGVYQWLLNQSPVTSIESQLAEVAGFDKCDRELFVGLLRGTITTPDDFEQRGWCSEVKKVLLTYSRLPKAQ